MRWHQGNTEPSCEKDYPKCLVETKDGGIHLAYWQNYEKYFVLDDESVRHIDKDFIERWGYVYEDDCITDEMLALNAIQSAVEHALSLYSVLLTDSICCGEEYRKLVGLDDLAIVRNKLINRILFLDSQI
jgi:hypothetical protein